MSISIEDRKKVILHTFQNGYFGHVILAKTLWSDLEEYISNYAASIKSGSSTKEEMIKLRGSIWESIEDHELNEYPVAERHMEKVSSWLDSVLGLEEEVSPKIHKSELLEEEYIFKTFERSLGEYVTLLEENKSILGHGTTGLTSWQGALMLTDWFVVNTHILKDSRILELGSGVGLLGIHLLKTIPTIREYTFTDTNDSVLNFLNYNISLNLTPREPQGKSSYKTVMVKGPPRVFKGLNANSLIAYYQREGDRSSISLQEASVSLRKLDWNNGLPKCNLRDFDVILGSDIVYERSLIPPLVQILVASMRRRVKAYIACTERSTTTLELFETEVRLGGLCFQVVYKGMYSPRENILSSDVQHQRTRIYEIFKDYTSTSSKESQVSRTL